MPLMLGYAVAGDFKAMIYFLIFAVILGGDILSKLWAVNVLEETQSIPLWQGVFHLTYVENTGAAFGAFRGGRIFFIIVTLLILAVIVCLIPKYKGRSRLLDTGMTAVAAGAVGNLLDRIFRGFVVDFFDFCLIDFPVFNIADIFVCVGALLIAVYVIFFDESTRLEKDSEENDN